MSDQETPETSLDAKAPETKDLAEPSDQTPKPTVGIPHLSKWQRLKAWLGTKKGRVIASVIGVLVVAGVAIGATDLRYPVVGLIYHSHTQITVLDSITSQPLPEATVSLAGQSAKTDKQGKAKLANLTLGHSTLTITKKAYKTHHQATIVPIRPISFAPIKLESAGTAMVLNVTDKISGKPLDAVDVAIGDTQAVSENGITRIVLLPEMGQTVTATLTKDGFLKTTITLSNKAATEPTKVSLVPSGKTYFLSNRSGHIDLYESNLDGSEATVVLPGTGSETPETGILANVSHANVLALVSTRLGRRAPNGSLISDLFIFDTETRDVTKVEEAVGFGNYRAWIGDSLVYNKFNSDYCGSIKAYNAVNKKSTTIFGASGGACSRISATYDELVFYSVTGPDTTKTGFYAIKANASDQKKLSSNPGDEVQRKTKDTLLFVYYNYNLPKPELWQSVNFDTLAITKLDSGPTTRASRSYIESANEAYTVFIEERDGKSELYLTDHDGKNERKLTDIGSVNQFVQWHHDRYIVFSSNKPNENALYVVSVDGGQAQKITDFYRANNTTYGGGYNPNY